MEVTFCAVYGSEVCLSSCRRMCPISSLSKPALSWCEMGASAASGNSWSRELERCGEERLESVYYYAYWECECGVSMSRATPHSSGRRSGHAHSVPLVPDAHLLRRPNDRLAVRREGRRALPPRFASLSGLDLFANASLSLPLFQPALLR